MKISELVTKVGSKDLAINRRYPKDIVSKYVSDLVEIVELCKDGRNAPSSADLCSFFLEEYNIEVTPCTVKRHLDRVKKGLPVWQK